MTRPEGRRAWLREGRRALDAKREREAGPIPRSRAERAAEVKRRFDEELAFEHAANRCYETHRATGRMRNGRRYGAPPQPYEPPLVPEGEINATDPDSQLIRTPRGGSASRAITRRPRSPTPRSSSPPRSPPTHRTSGTWNRSCERCCATSSRLR